VSFEVPTAMNECKWTHS